MSIMELERAAFEEYARRKGWSEASLRHEADGRYRSNDLNYMWNGWVARAQAPTPREKD